MTLHDTGKNLSYHEEQSLELKNSCKPQKDPSPIDGLTFRGCPGSNSTLN